MTGSEAELILLKKKRTVLRNTFTKLANNILDILKDNTSSDELEAKFSTLKDKHEALINHNELVMNKLYEVDAEEVVLEDESNCSDEYTSKFYLIQAKYNKLVAVSSDNNSNVESQAISSNVSGSGRPSNINIRLPVIEFVKFDGDTKNWLNFWSQFQKIHNSSELSDQDKFQYLLQATVAESRARTVVSSFPPTAENYAKAIDSLKSRFGREDLQIEIYVRELLNLTFSNFKEKKPISFLYDKIETQLRALDTLGVTSDKCAALLYPLIESCLSEDLVRVWQRSLNSHFATADKPLDLKSKLDSLVKFLKSEVESEERVKLAVDGFESCNRLTKRQTRTSQQATSALQDEVDKARVDRCLPSSAASLVNSRRPEGPNPIQSKCVFCSGSHSNENCFKARKMTYVEKTELLKKNGLCFLCLKPKHLAKHCKAKLRCAICDKRHSFLMCMKKDETAEEAKTENSLSACTKSEVLLQTLCVYVKEESGRKRQRARALIDTGSQRSYITKKLANDLKYKPIRKEKLRHSLFGGFQSNVEEHSCYKIRLQSLQGDYACNFDVLDQVEICKSIPTAGTGPWVQEFTKLGIELTDIDSGSIDILIGADVAGKLLTDERLTLDCGLVAVGTHLGWTLLGRVTPEHWPMVGVSPDQTSESLTCSTTLLLRDKPLTQLWELDTLGIQDPTMKRSKDEETAASLSFFKENVKREDDGRYKVSLLWKEGHPPLPSNINIAKKRLENTVNKLKHSEKYDAYNEVFKEWESEGIIESVPVVEDLGKHGHYLPHRPVFKEGSTTKIRPVFDASAREYNQPSLNDCLSTGANLIERIPSILLGFRFNKIGVTADIKKAFLQINLYENDRDYLRFLWMDHENNIKIYRHNRVVFGVSCSPFLLGATINYHLDQVGLNESTECESKNCCTTTVDQLKNGFYVDNCLLSVSTEDELNSLITESSDIFLKAKMELRGWEYTDRNLPPLTKPTPILGMLWDRKEDGLKINTMTLGAEQLQGVTKRTILSQTNKVFDVIGFSAPVTIVPKIILQKVWKLNLKWDQEVPQELKEMFLKWHNELQFLSEIMIPRWLSGHGDSRSLHVFNDASKFAYATVIFLRTETNSEVNLHLITAKSRVAPVKPLTIPRLELLAANIGARLSAEIKLKLDIPDNNVFYWSDSTTVLSWIQRDDCWTTFVWNRTKEIRELSAKDSWRFVPGSLNPADLASRGCSAKELYKLRWWEGPEWLKAPPEEWPKNEFICKEEDIDAERSKTKPVVKNLLTTQNEDNEWYYSYFSKFEKIVRMIGWMKRFAKNCRKPNKRQCGPLTVEELCDAEISVIRLIQQDSFLGTEDKQLKTVCSFLDEKGVIRIKTKITERDDNESFRSPIVLPPKHPVVRLLIHDQHIKSSHAGVQSLLCILRERFWILNGRKTIRSILRKCITCLRHTSRNLEAKPASLPMDRVKEAAAFQVCGVDFAGPLLMKNGEKAWICLFTCAIYRAVHLELVTSLSTNDFIQALRRFISRRGRPSVCYSDNGTNFVGANNAMSQLDWENIHEFSTAQRIIWKFNPPSAPWWGGWWERLVGLVKQTLRRVLGKAYLSYEELYTILCDCEATLNSRPLTYVSENPNDLIPLTPAMFLTDLKLSEVPDLDQIGKAGLNKRLRYRQKLKDHLRRRFRIEYLGMLTAKSRKFTRKLKKGEVVLIESEDKRRLQWPLAFVEEVIPGKDGEVRLAKLRTKSGTILRPIQRLHPLEIQNNEEIVELKNIFKNGVQVDETKEHVPEKKTNIQEKEKDVPKSQDDASKGNTLSRCGRTIKLPSRYK